MVNEVFSRRLKSARLMRGLSMDSLCERMENAVSKQSISKYENGKMMPDSTTLISLSQALNVSVDFFFRPYTVSLDSMEFRKKCRLKVSSLNAIKEKVLDEIERYLEIENLLEMDNLFTVDYSDKMVTTPEGAREIAIRLRRDWKLGEDAINNIIFLLEENGIKVIQLDTDEEFDGLSGFVNKVHPVIIVNKKAYAERQRFTVLHELGHLLLHFDTDMPDKAKERLCNVFANEMLLPSSQFIEMVGASRKDISLQELIPLQKQYGLSIDAMMYKAKELGIITEQRYKGYCIKRSSSADFHRQVIEPRYPREDSRRFQTLVYKAISQEVISISKASSLLNCSVNEIRSSISYI